MNLALSEKQNVLILFSLERGENVVFLQVSKKEWEESINLMPEV